MTASKIDPDGAPKFYGRRKGRPLRAGRLSLVETLLPTLTIPTDRPDLDPVTLFDAPVEKVWLEVGFGGGEHLAALAERHPEIGFLGCEPFINGVAKLLSAVDEGGLTNVRILADDARLLMAALRPGSLDRVFVLFPDPWPKRRHWARRFIGPENLPELARILRPGGELRIATDHPGYLDWILAHMTRCRDFDWLAERSSDWLNRPDDWQPTRYERKSLAGRPHYLRFLRRPDRD